MVFGKLISELRFEDLEQLRKKDVRESVVLEYKSTFESHARGSDRTLKEVSAFANTFGGYLIYGIKDRRGQHSGQIESIPGVDPIPNFKQTITQWALQWLYPPLLTLEVSDPIPVGGDGKVCYVVHVPPSPSGPHFVLERRGCYVRVRIDEHSMTFEPKLAKVDEILRLADRRRAILEQRDNIVQTALKRWEARGRRHASLSGSPVPVILLWAVPEFPLERLIEPAKLHDVIWGASVKYTPALPVPGKDVDGRQPTLVIEEFPCKESNWFTQQDAVIVEKPGFQTNSHLEVSAWGSVLAAQELAHEQSFRTGPGTLPDCRRCHLVMYPMLYLLFLRNLLRGLGFAGPVLVHVELRHIRNITIQDLDRMWGVTGDDGTRDYAVSVADDSVSWENTVWAAQLASDVQGYVLSAYRTLAFGVGCRDAHDKPDNEEIIKWGVSRARLDEKDLRPSDTSNAAAGP